MSQIGYMFLGAGIGAYANAMFLLMAHAFFKALLFLGAGIVIHALNGEQDIRKMGGLRKLMPKTWWAMLIGGLALAGMPPLSGFFAKDSILASSLAREDWYGYVLFGAGVVGAFFTGLYTFRMLFVVFGGEQSAYVREHPPHASHDRLVEWSMGLTVATLAVLSVVGGWIQVGTAWTPITDWLDPVAKPLVDATSGQEVVASACAVLLGLAGIGFAWWIYSAHRVKAPRPWAVLEHKFYFDEFYNGLFYWPAVALSRILDWTVEGPVVNGSIVGVASLTRRTGGWFRELQTGLVRVYAFAVAAGLAVLVLVFIAVR
jgi:NADH-quinone oxidoreductase subunit L